MYESVWKACRVVALPEAELHPAERAICTYGAMSKALGPKVVHSEVINTLCGDQYTLR